MSTWARRTQLRTLLERSGREWTLRELAARLGVSKLTAQRDLDELSRSGVAVMESSRGQTLRYRAGEARAAALETTEAVSLDAACAAMEPFRTTPLIDGLEAARQRAGALGPASEVVAPFRPTAAHHMAPSVVRALLEGIRAGRRVRIDYTPRAARRSREYLVEPHQFVVVHGVVYLRAAVPPATRRATFVGWRIHGATLSAEEATVPRARSSSAFAAFEGTPEDVEVRFDSEIAPYIRERRWHASERFTAHRDGGVTWRARVSGPEEVIGWVMSWGARAELIKPLAWRREALARARQVVERYA